MSQPEPQPVLTPLTEAAIFLTAVVERGGETAVRELISDVNDLRQSVGFRIPEGMLSCVVGIGAGVWDQLFGEPRPSELHPFRELHGPRHSAPATPGDLLFHIRAHRLDLCFELAQHLGERLGGCAQIVDEVHGFRSFDERDLLGFVDGTANPEGAAARESVLIADDDPRFAGGAYVVVQKYLHDIPAWESLSVEDQQRAIGRTKLSDIEFPDELKAADSHVLLNTVVDEDGGQRQIVRFNMPFGNVKRHEYGTYFIGYASSSGLIEEMLENMFLGRPRGTHDRLLDFSTAITGNLFFVPPLEFLDIPAPDRADEPAQATERQSDAEVSTLAIGSLKGSSS